MLCVGWEGGTILEWLLSLGDMTFGFGALASLVQTICNRYFLKLLFNCDVQRLLLELFCPGILLEILTFHGACFVTCKVLALLV